MWFINLPFCLGVSQARNLNHPMIFVPNRIAQRRQKFKPDFVKMHSGINIGATNVMGAAQLISRTSLFLFMKAKCLWAKFPTDALQVCIGFKNILYDMNFPFVSIFKVRSF